MQEEQTQNNDFVDVVKTKKSRYSVTPHITLDNFKGLFNNDMLIYYDKHGRDYEFDNLGVFRRITEEVKDKNGKPVLDENKNPKLKYTVYMKTYISLSGDVVMISWYDGEVSFYTKLAHPDLHNWGRKMYWKV
jgi:hypothetical protein